MTTAIKYLSVIKKMDIEGFIFHLSHKVHWVHFLCGAEIASLPSFSRISMKSGVSPPQGLHVSAMDPISLNTQIRFEFPKAAFKTASSFHIYANGSFSWSRDAVFHTRWRNTILTWLMCHPRLVLWRFMTYHVTLTSKSWNLPQQSRIRITRDHKKQLMS